MKHARSKRGFVIGITGGIATGKSEVLRLLQRRGFAVLSSDEIGHACMKPGTTPFKKIVRHFGRSVVTTQGEIDRRKLGEIVFRRPAERRILESYIHPCVRQALARFAKKNAGRPVALDVPLLFEARMTDLVGHIVVVSAPLRIQLSRLQTRNGFRRAEALRRIRSQWPLRRKEALADTVLRNDGTRGNLARRVDRWLTSLKDER